MSKELVVKDEVCFETMLADITSMQAICVKLMQTKHFQALGEVGIFAILQKAKSIGMNALDALSGGMYFVNGKVELSSNSMGSLIRKGGHSIVKDPKSDKTICILHGKRVDNGDTLTTSFSIADAKQAGIYKNVWEKYPEDLLYCRALTRMCRQLFQDVGKGCYVEGEIRDGVIDNPRHRSYEQDMQPTKIQQVPFEEIVKYIDVDKLEVLKHMIGHDVELMKLILTFSGVTSLDKIPESISDKIIKRVAQRLEENQKKSLEIVEENRKVMEA